MYICVYIIMDIYIYIYTYICHLLIFRYTIYTIKTPRKKDSWWWNTVVVILVMLKVIYTDTDSNVDSVLTVILTILPILITLTILQLMLLRWCSMCVWIPTSCKTRSRMPPLLLHAEGVTTPFWIIFTVTKQYTWACSTYAQFTQQQSTQAVPGRDNVGLPLIGGKATPWTKNRLGSEPPDFPSLAFWIGCRGRKNTIDASYAVGGCEACKTEPIHQHHQHHQEGVVCRSVRLNSGTVAVSNITSRRWSCIEFLSP